EPVLLLPLRRPVRQRPGRGRRSFHVQSGGAVGARGAKERAADAAVICFRRSRGKDRGSMNTELIEYTTAEHMANVFAVESSRIREAVETLADASQHLREVFRDSYRFTVNAACGVNCRDMT